MDSGNVDALMIGDNAAVDNIAFDGALAHPRDAQLNRAVVEQNRTARLNIRGQPREGDRRM